MGETSNSQYSESEPGKTSWNGSTEDFESGKGWSDFVNVIIEQVETVSSHFHYTEEYVLGKSFGWLNRKSKQIHREVIQKQQINTLDVYRGFLLTVDSVLNQGKQFDKIMPKTLDELENENKQIENDSVFVSGTWWLPERQD